MGVALAVAGASAVSPAAAERYEDGISAYKRNEFDKSIKTLRPLAEKGDARAQYMLGRHYQFGQGTKADRAEAYFWYRRAETKGHLEAKLFRQLLEKRWKLTADEKTRGERRLAELNAPKAKPEKPKIETATAREPARPGVTSKPSEPPIAESARTPPPEKAPAKPVVAARNALPAMPAPPAKSAAEAVRPAAAAERSEANRTPARRPAPEDQEETETADVRAYSPGPPPVETRAALTPPAPNYPTADTEQPAYNAPRYTPPNYSQLGYPSYAPPYYAPGAPPSWRPQAYYAPPPTYYAPAWNNRPSGYWHPGWRGAASWGPRAGFRRYRGY